MFNLEAATTIARRELKGMTATAAALEMQDWTRPTRCEGWTVARLCSHAGLAARQQAEAFRRAAKGLLEPPEFPGAPDLSPAEILDLLRGGTEALGAALAELPPDVIGAMTPMPFGVVPTVVAIQITVLEYAIHGDDLRAAVGDASPFPDDVAAALLEFFPGLAGRLAARAQPGTRAHTYRLTGTNSSVTLEPEGVLDAPVCEIAGPDAAIVLFAMGRIAADDPRLTVSGPAAAAAAEFKRWFPGP